MAHDIRTKQTGETSITWQEESGLVKFLSSISAEVKRFDESFDFGVEVLSAQPETIDGSADLLPYLGFVVLRKNSAVIDRDYCLYSVLRGKSLHGYIGVYAKGSIETVRELGLIADFRNAEAGLLDWLRGLMKASCDKP